MTNFISFCSESFIILAGAFGLIASWSGLRGLLSGEAGMLGRMKGFRLVVFGLMFVGFASAMLWQARWLVLLSLGIGFVEVLESSTLIAVWKWGRRNESRRVGLPALGDPAR
jgi:hypothetical protein